MAHFVLVHGAWHGAWCFGWLREELEDRGHDVETPELPGDSVGLDQRAYAELIGPRPNSIVVGHSLGAQTAALVEARCHVYLGGVLPVVERASEAFAGGFGGFVRDEDGRSYWPDPDTAAARLYPDCPRATADWAFPQLRPQAPFDTIVGAFGSRDVVLVTTEDAAIDPDWQRRTAKAHGARCMEIRSGHSPFFTQPEELADVLDRLA